MLDLILAYFKSIYLFFENLEEMVGAESKSGDVDCDSEINKVIQEKTAGIGSGNLMKKIFSLKETNECETEASM